MLAFGLVISGSSPGQSAIRSGVCFVRKLRLSCCSQKARGLRGAAKVQTFHHQTWYSSQKETGTALHSLPELSAAGSCSALALEARLVGGLWNEVRLSQRSRAFKKLLSSSAEESAAVVVVVVVAQAVALEETAPVLTVTWPMVMLDAFRKSIPDSTESS